MKITLKKKDKDKMTEDEKGIIETYGKNVSFINKEEIKEIMEYCRK